MEVATLAVMILLQTGSIMLAIIGSGFLVYGKAAARESVVLVLLGIVLTLGMILTGMATI